MADTYRTSLHDRFAPSWAAALLLLCVTGLATIWIDLGRFWKGYVLDMTGPAWNYILFRGLYATWSSNPWTRFFTPTRTLAIFTLAVTAIKTAQYLGLYQSTFDPFDFLAYFSLLLPVYLLDRIQQNSAQNRDDAGQE